MKVHESTFTLISIYVDEQRGLTQGRLCPKAAAQCSTRCHPNLRSLVLQSDRINYKQKGASKSIEMTPAKPPLQMRYARSSSMPGCRGTTRLGPSIFLQYIGLPVCRRFSAEQRSVIENLWKQIFCALRKSMTKTKAADQSILPVKGCMNFPQRCGFTWRYDQNFKRMKKGRKE